MLRSCAASRKISPEEIWQQQQQDVDEDSADEEAPHESDNIKRWIFPDRPGAQPYSSTDLSKEERSAIIVGPTTSGKSELLRALHKIYSRDRIPESLVVGHGNTSTTATVTEYPLSVCCVSCKTVRNRDLKWEAGPPNESEVLKIFKGGRRDSRDYYLDTYMAKPVYGKHKFQVNFLDCPGDRDSKGRDEDHMADIAVRLARKGKLAAVIFVIGKGMPYDLSFQESFKYFWDWLKNYHNHFIIVHTKWSMLEPGAEAERAAREREFSEDEDPGERDCMAFNQQKKALAINSMNALITEIALASNIDCAMLPFRKTRRMHEVDRQLIAGAEAALDAAQATLDTTDRDLAVLNKEMREISRRVAEGESHTAPLMCRLEAIDVDTDVEIARKEAWIYWFWGWRCLRVETRVPISNVVTTDGTFRISWTDWERTAFSVQVTCSTGLVPTFYMGSLVVYGASRHVHAAEIAQIKAELEPIRAKIKEDQADLKHKQDAEKYAKEVLEGLNKLIEENTLVSRVASMQELRLDQLGAVHEWYKAAVGKQLSSSDLREYIQLLGSLPVRPATSSFAG
ncbi:unnamed protein product [Symbiodinium microadriaticum]|nr:unnamed protein product [Symbiodinium microadriaticum]